MRHSIASFWDMLKPGTLWYVTKVNSKKEAVYIRRVEVCNSATAYQTCFPPTRKNPHTTRKPRLKGEFDYDGVTASWWARSAAEVMKGAEAWRLTYRPATREDVRAVIADYVLEQGTKVGIPLFLLDMLDEPVGESENGH